MHAFVHEVCVNIMIMWFHVGQRLVLKVCEEDHKRLKPLFSAVMPQGGGWQRVAETSVKAEHTSNATGHDQSFAYCGEQRRCTPSLSYDTIRKP